MIVDYRRLYDLAVLKKDTFMQGTPFPHVVIDDFFESSIFDTIRNAFPLPDSTIWKEPTNKHTRHKRVFKSDEFGLKEPFFGELARRVFLEFNSGLFIRFLTELTGISTLIGDPYLAEAGFHCTGDGGYLDIHADFSHHDILQLERRINLILFLNDDWYESYNGNLSLYDRNLVCVQEIAPIANRCVIFATSDHSFHGHPKPMNLPMGKYRKSIAMYYYSIPSADRTKSAIIFPEDPTFKHVIRVQQ